MASRAKNRRGKPWLWRICLWGGSVPEQSMAGDGTPRLGSAARGGHGIWMDGAWRRRPPGLRGGIVRTDEQTWLMKLHYPDTPEEVRITYPIRIRYRYTADMRRIRIGEVSIKK